MLPALGALDNQIITNSLNLCIQVNEEQITFYKKKLTIQQLFVRRVLIKIAKKTRTRLYIGFLHLEKAWYQDYYCNQNVLN